MIDFKALDFRKVQRYLSPQAMEDLNAFLEKLSQNAGHTVLMAAGIAWAGAAASGLFATIQIKALIESRAKLAEAEALLPPVPKIEDIPVPKNEVEAFVKTLKDTYRGVDIKSTGSTIVISSKTTAAFSEFREAVGHVQNGGAGWRVSIDKLCVGRECQTYQLGASLKINKVSVKEAEIK